ncbi:dTDP-glucose 4,6-dehydratase [Patescibacteria group bacterium]|nr:MAG: dTDP-glucose 4,6-dehydratase [Patescibacteria group bacterium]
MKILVTGGAGFIGSNFIRYMLKQHPDYKIINLDKLTYAGNLENLKEVEDNPNYSFVKGDICNDKAVEGICEKGIDAIINFAAETHVDRSITDPQAFIKTDIFGAQTLLEAVNKYKIKKYIQVSTDEVYGSINDGSFKETDFLDPSSPYSASKAGADLLVLAYKRTFDTPVIITRCSNNYGPSQYPEKLIPLFTTNAMEDKELPIYGKGENVRDWIYVEDHCSAIDSILHKGEIGEIYNVGADQEKTNLEVTEAILKAVDKPKSLIKFVKDRPGHDLRYAIDSSKLQKLGWKPKYDFEKGMELTVEWYQKNEDWWRKIKSGEYLKYYKKQYGRR